MACVLPSCARAEMPLVYPTTDASVYQTTFQPVLSMTGDAAGCPPIVPGDATESVLSLPEMYPEAGSAEPYGGGIDPHLDDPGGNYTRRGVVPYGGGHIYDWPWGCGSSPYRNGPGMCDDWYVGPVWDIGVDGMVLFREDTNLAAIEAAADNPVPPLYTNQFDYAGGGRVYATGKLPRDVGYRLQFGYEGVQNWNAAIVYPEVVVDPADQIDARRSIHYNSNLNSAEINVLPRPFNRLWQPYVGIRYVRLADEITDRNDQFAPPPLPDEITTFDDTRTNFDIKNNLIGFQTGLRLDLWKLNQRLSIEGFVNAGVYYNTIQRSDGMFTTTTVLTGDDTTTPDDDETSSSSFTTGTAVKTNPTDVAYLAEASLSGVCRVNKCLAVRGGYQILWIDGIHLASDAYLNSSFDQRGFVFDGWHIGAEYRR